MATRKAPRTARGRPPPKALTLVSLERSALWHLERRALTTAQLRRALERKARGSLENARAAEWIDDVIARCTRSGLLDDTRVAQGRTAALRAQGKSARLIAQKLRHKGVDDATAQAALAEHSSPAQELEAARVYVRKRRLLGKDPQKALAALARQGFSFAIAKQALAGAAPTAHDEE